MKQKLISDELILFFIILVAGILRFYDFSNLPMTHDELSTVSRLNFSTFRDLIENGVKIDTHPAGIQVFLYYWTRLFGCSEALLKLPFLLMGLGSIPLAWLLSKRWFNSSTALLVAASIATLQFPVMHSQIARPYISGLFFCLLMVLFWTRMLFERDHRKILNSVAYVISASLCAYNHHFSLLFAFIVGVTGLFYLEKNRVRTYLLSLCGIAVLYIPHLNIFFDQLNQEGLHWLAEPANSFILDYIGYVFHFNFIVYLSVSGLVIAGIYMNRENINRVGKFRVISMILFLSPVLIGFIYSKYFMPVIQYSVLIFSFPYLLFFLFSFNGKGSQGFKIFSVVLILAVNISTLVWSRQHYRIFYKQPFERYSVLTRDFLKQNSPENVSIILQGDPRYIDYYFKEDNPGIEYFSTFRKDINPVEFMKILESQSTDFLISGGNQLQHLALIREDYPYLVFRDFGFTYEYYIFSRNLVAPGEIPPDDILFSSKLEGPGEIDNWQNTALNTGPNPQADSPSQNFFEIDSNREWGPTFEIELSDVVDSRHDFIDVSVEFMHSLGDEGLIICEIRKNERILEWKSSSTGDFFDTSGTGDWQKGFLSQRLTSVFKRNSDMKGCTLRVYFWNKDKGNIKLDNFIVRVRKGNEYVYSLIERMN